MVRIYPIFEDFYGFLKKHIRVLAIIFYSMFLLRNAILIYKKWPNGVWEELFISYAGGFVRRGLVGETLYYLQSHGINIRILLPICVTLFSVLFLLYCFLFIKKNIDNVSSLFISLSPGIFIFGYISLHDFARKDGIVALIVILLMNFAQKDGLFSRIGLCLLISGGLLIHEALFFYLPMPILLLYLHRYQEHPSRLFILTVSLGFCLCLCLILLYSGKPGQYELMELQWRTVVPDFTANNLMRYIGVGLLQVNPWITGKFLYAETLLGIFFGLLLTLAPIVYWSWRMKLPSQLLSAFPGRTEKVMLCAALLSPCALLLIEPDFGRRISLFAIELIFFLIFFCKMKNISLEKNEKFSNRIFIILLLVSFTWKMHHWTIPGESIIVFVPDHLIEFMGLSFFVFILLRGMRRKFARHVNNPKVALIFSKIRAFG